MVVGELDQRPAAHVDGLHVADGVAEAGQLGPLLVDHDVLVRVLPLELVNLVEPSREFAPYIRLADDSAAKRAIVAQTRPGDKDGSGQLPRPLRRRS